MERPGLTRNKLLTVLTAALLGRQLLFERAENTPLGADTLRVAVCAVLCRKRHLGRNEERYLQIGDH